ncbi:MAG TPA: DUF1844 domain-containing protein [Desulfohalobiaceae bacterium]|nr:DUF1844 domain-containing protein [Desulfohalobiaceae bacterium]
MTDEEHKRQENDNNDQSSFSKTEKELHDAAKAYSAQAHDTSENDPLPKVDLNTFILSLSSSALVQLGDVPEPETGTIMKNLSLARHTIDILAMLEEKTKGNLKPDEDDLLKNILFELRMKYVQKVT